MPEAWNVSGKVCVVTGGNSGIGLETVIGLAKQGAHTVLVSRNPERGERALEAARAAAPEAVVDLVVGDLGTLASTRALAAELLQRCPQIHVLVNNAGVLLTERRETPDGLEETFAVNHLAPFLLTNLLLDRLVASEPARVVNVSSAGHRMGKLDFDDLQATRRFGRVRTYCDSKLCNILFTRELSRLLEGTQVTANSLHPGVVHTNLAHNAVPIVRWFTQRVVGPLFLKTPAQGAHTSLYVATSPELSEVSGRYFSNSRETTPTRAARDDVAARLLWQKSEELAGIAARAEVA